MKKKNTILIIGAGGHAKEVLDILERTKAYNGILFYDDINKETSKLFSYKVLKNKNDVFEELSEGNPFIIAVGGTKERKRLFQKFMTYELKPASLISESALIGKHDVEFGNGLNIMDRVSISSSVKIGDGILLNRGCSIHHDVVLGEFTTIGPGAQILGKCKIGDNCDIGGGAIVLPNIKIYSNTIIGAGAVVTKNISKPGIYTGIPAKLLYD